MKRLYFENNTGESKELSIGKLRDMITNEGFLIELREVDNEGNMYFQENACVEYE